MAIDGAFLYAIKNELSQFIGGRVDKIAQPSREELIITIRASGGNKKVIMSASANTARVHLTTATVENPKVPPMFCMLMRKHLGSAKLLGIRQDGLERILYFDFEAMNEIGDMVTLTLAVEIMGRYSNVILINSEGRVIDSIKRVDAEMSRERLILPGIRYEYPQRDDRISILTATKEEIREKLYSVRNDDLAKCLVRTFEGIAPLFARECVYNCHDGDILRDDITDGIFDRLVEYIFTVREKMLGGKNDFTVLIDKDNALKDFSFADIKQYGELMTVRHFETAGETLDYFYSERDNFSRMKQRSADMLKLLANTSERISRKLAIQKSELMECAKKDELKMKGDLINANIYRIEKGAENIELENYYDENKPVKIKMDTRLSPSQNAQKYYAEYRKAVTAEKMLADLISKGEQEPVYIASVFDALTRSVTEAEILELREELTEQGYIRRRGAKQKAGKSLPPLEFTSSDGYRILVGRNNRQNDTLTLKTADKTDIWLHTKDIPGSHVIIFTGGTTPPDETIREAAVLAAYHSKAKTSAQVPVDYVEVRYVKKPSGSKPGMVIFTNNRTLYVTPDGELAERLKK